MMSALIDRHTMTVTYDSRRGEPRAPLRVDGHAREHGDCIDCAQCVTVCPTGIDIRNGIQLECIACTACMDACDTVMRRVDRPPGLIRTTSADAIDTGAPRWLSPRVKAYAAVWVVLVTSVATLIATRPDVDVLILRQAGTLYTTLPDDRIGNFYTVQVINRTNRPQQLEYRASSPEGGRLTPLGALDTVVPHGLVEGRFLLALPTAMLMGGSTPVSIEIHANGQRLNTITSAFVGPVRPPGGLP